MKGTLTAVAVLCLVGALGEFDRAAAEEILFVSDLFETGNWDVYGIDSETAAVRRLTTDPAIDNHPDRSPDGTMVVWSSTRNLAGGNDDGDFELFIATDEGGEGGLENGTLLQITFNDSPDEYPDRHPHFNHDPDNMKIIYTAKYVCVQTSTTQCVSVCSIPTCIEVIDPCGRRCEAIRVMNPDGSGIIDIDHEALSAANPTVWPSRPLTDVRWVGHPSFSHDDSQILFSGAVDGQGRNWEVYVADWDGEAVSNLRRVTDESIYSDTPNPIKMTGGACFTPDDSEIVFTSTRTEFGNSQLFVLPTGSEMVPVSEAIRHPASSDQANDYVPQFLDDGRMVVTSDREEYWSLATCRPACEPPEGEYTVDLDLETSHTIRVEASGEADGSSAGLQIHLDAYALDTTLVEQDMGTTYSGTWSTETSPNASAGHYEATDGTSLEFVDIDVPAGTPALTLYLGRTLSSGIARIYVDDEPIIDGDTALPGDTGDDKSGINLFTPDFAVSNDVDLVVISADGSTQTNLTDNDSADEMILIGDEVSWFCGLSPNLSECTYLPKSFTIEQLRLIAESETRLAPENPNFPSLCLYPICFQALDTFMTSAGNQLRPNHPQIWFDILQRMQDPKGQFDDQLVVLPAPVNCCVDNLPPTVPSDPLPPDGSILQGLPPDLVLAVTPSTDPENDSITYDFYLGRDGAAMMIIESDSSKPMTLIENAELGTYEWRVVVKDCRGGLKYGPVYTFEIVKAPCEGDANGDGTVDPLDAGFVLARFGCAVGTGDPSCDAADQNGDGVVDPLDSGFVLARFGPCD